MLSFFRRKTSNRQTTIMTFLLVSVKGSRRSSCLNWTSTLSLSSDIEEDMPKPPAPLTVAPQPPASSPPVAYGTVDLHSESSSMVATTSIASRGGDDSDTERYRLQICVREPEKIGDGMSSYMVYKIHTRVRLLINSMRNNARGVCCVVMRMLSVFF